MLAAGANVSLKPRRVHPSIVQPQRAWPKAGEAGPEHTKAGTLRDHFRRLGGQTWRVLSGSASPALGPATQGYTVEEGSLLISSRFSASSNGNPSDRSQAYCTYTSSSLLVLTYAVPSRLRPPPESLRVFALSQVFSLP